jgi:multiple sugar transport system permease protein
MTRSLSVGRSAKHGVLWLLGLGWLAPVYLVVGNASKAPVDFDSTRVWQPPGTFALFENMHEAWTSAGMGASVFPTVLYSIVAPALSVLVGAAAGFGIVALRLRAGLAWFMFIFSGIVFPLQMLLMPLFVGYAKIGIFDTRSGMILVYTAVGVPFAALVLRNYFSGIARTIYEAAVVDGATNRQIFLRVYVPMSGNALLTVFLFQATSVWNDLLLGLVLTQSPGVRPVMPALTGLQGQYGGSSPPTMLAGALLVSLPTVFLFLGAQRYFVRGLTLSQS